MIDATEAPPGYIAREVDPLAQRASTPCVGCGFWVDSDDGVKTCARYWPTPCVAYRRNDRQTVIFVRKH